MRAVRESARRVVAQSRSVWVDEEALRTGARLLAPHALTLSWDRYYHFFDGTARTVQYLFVLDSLNFCFWPEPRWRYRYENEWLDGYLALASSLKEAVSRDATLLQAAVLARMNEKRLREILGGENEIPLLQERVAVLREAGAVLQEEYDGQAVHLVEEARRSTERLVQLLVERFSSFRDEALYRGERVCFYKRAQIFCADLYGAFEGERWGEFTDIEGLTAFADYKLPQVLRHLGILHYSPELAQKIDRREELAAGSEEEIEIRAHTIWAVERLREEVCKLGRSLRSFEIDWLLWNLGQREEFRQKPYHRTRTIFY
ncbi:MAG: queuosine salvage family protein [Candidatus Bipolaricaulota bacterium]|nr:queuosine salvage family protein [Candidatus Bipolaricaulota bacterium]MCS7274052.1 queuosine salvage family protein [Candidatus Bipolaricaulota bacterium]MDW8110649.1 queuosine salvage family protein [Candidatus Bipolaricaulota bacterium]MDW8328493.1 queuosine salvage family protein [Candidatus Bipolaricaulota bacterium]